MTFDVPSSSAGATPAATALDPVVVANPVAGTGATAYPADLPPITSISMLRSRPPFAWKLDLPVWKRPREEFVATTWEVEVQTQDGPQEPPLKISFPCAIMFPDPGGGWKEGETIIALYAYQLRGGHWRMDCSAHGRAGVPEGQRRRLAALPLTGVRGWGDRPEEHMRYCWLQMHTQAKEEQRRRLGQVGGSPNLDAEEGGEGGAGRCLLHVELQERRAQGQGPAPQGPQTSRQVGWPALGCKAPAGKAGRRSCGRLGCGATGGHARVAEAGTSGGRGGSPPAGQALGGRAASTGGGQWRQSGSGTIPGRRPANPSRRRARRDSGRKSRRKGGGEGAGVGVDTKYFMAGSQAWKARAEKMKGELSTVVSTARLLLHQREGPTFESVVPGYQAALDSHEAV